MISLIAVLNNRALVSLPHISEEVTHFWRSMVAHFCGGAVTTAVKHCACTKVWNQQKGFSYVLRFILLAYYGKLSIIVRMCNHLTPVWVFYHFVLKSLFTWSEQNHGDDYILLLPYATDCCSISSSIRLNSQMIGSDKKVIDTFKLFYLTCFDPIWAYRDNTTKSGPTMTPIFKKLVRIYK